MKNLTISQVTKQYNVTPRMLRHYEKLGLIQPVHEEGYAYRMYDENTIRRLRQILILRKLRIPLKEISIILQDKHYQQTFGILKNAVDGLDTEISSLLQIRDLLKALTVRLEESIGCHLRFDLLEDDELVEVLDILPLSKSNIKEKCTMNELNKANETINKKSEIRIVLLPPCTVASYQFVGENPEEKVENVMSTFIQESGLYEKKPDARLFGMNHPSPGVLENGLYGYEDWVTIPEDMELPEPMEKKQFAGGLYAVMTIRFPEFYRWEELKNWVGNGQSEYEIDYRNFGDAGFLEEHLNWVYAAHKGWPENGIDGQVDLMLPIKKRDSSHDI